MNKTAVLMSCLLALPSIMNGMTVTDSLPVPGSIDSVAPSVPATVPQRKVTPIRNTDNLTARPTLHYYDRHGNPLDEPVAIWLDEDTVKVDRAPKAPLFNGVTIGVNFFDAILQIAGQSYGNYNLSAAVDMHNWFFPTLELGVGIASSHPKDKNFRYECPGAFFARIGIDYNFLYNSNPDYKALFGIRAGYSSFSYDIKDITIPDDYWSYGSSSPVMPRQKASALWGEICAGLQVKIVRGFSMGWALRYKFRFHTGSGSDSTPWFIPGFGARNAPFSATFSMFYTFGSPTRKDERRDN